MGMSAAEYWDGDCTLTRAYKAAYEMRMEQLNFQVWLQGRYVYEAILGVAPVLHAFAKRTARPAPYPEKPYPITPRAKAAEEEERDLREMSKIRNKVESFAGRFNAKWKGVENADAERNAD